MKYGTKTKQRENIFKILTTRIKRKKKQSTALCCCPESFKRKYLGVCLDSRLTFKKRISNSTNKFFKTCNDLVHLFYHNGINMGNKLILCKFLIHVHSSISKIIDVDFFRYLDFYIYTEHN